MKIQVSDTQVQVLLQMLNDRQVALREQLSAIQSELAENERLVVALEGNDVAPVQNKPLPVEAAKKQWDKGDKKPYGKAKKGDDERRNKYLQIRALLSEGDSVVEACKKVGCTDVTYYNWLRKFGTKREIEMLGSSVSKYGPKKKRAVKEEITEVSEREELQPGEEDEEAIRARLVAG